MVDFTDEPDRLETSRQPDYETALARALDYFDLLLDTTLAYIGASEED